MRLILLALITLMFSKFSYAEYCVPTSQVCTEGAALRVIEGYERYRDCWSYKVDYKCYKDEVRNDCLSIENTPGCDSSSGQCLESGQDGQCNKFQKKFTCGRADSVKAIEGATLLESEYTIVKDEDDLIECNPNITNPDCHEVARVCVEGPEVRVINGKEVAKDCWKYETKHNCFASSEISECQEYEGKCKLITSDCLSSNKNGVCKHYVRKYSCQETSDVKPLAMNCKGASYCIGGNCEAATVKPNNNMGRAISGLNMLKELTQDFDREGCDTQTSKDCKVFKGKGQRCDTRPLGSLNCCRDDGWLQDIKLSSCSEGEAALSLSKSKGLCHYVGSYCSKKIVGVCVKTSRAYCCFESKLSRIIHEQGRAQLGVDWGNAKNPSCQPLTIGQLQSLDFSKIDFSEMYNEIKNKVTPEKIQQHSKDNTVIKNEIEEKVSQASGMAEKYGKRVVKHYESKNENK